MRINNKIHFGLFGSLVYALVLGTGFDSVSAQQLKFPYQAFVLHDETSVHSGPGQVHYATEQLRQGAVVEVYREDPGGWCAIRPVKGSFSLVPEATLEIVEDGVGRILENGTQAWVGTKLGPVEKPLWQVKLQAGEVVELLGQVSWPNKEGHSTLWYQISPPAGEFRWVQMSDIQLPVASKESSPWPQDTNRDLPINPSQTIRSFNTITPDSSTIDASTASSPRNGTSNLVRQATLQTEQPVTQPNINRGWRQASGRIGASFGSESLDRNNGIGTSSDGSLSNGLNERFRDLSGNNGLGYSSSNDMIRVADVNTFSPNLAMNLDAARNQYGFTGNFDSLNSTQPNPQFSRTPSRNLNDLELQLTREMIKQNPSDWLLEDLETAANGVYQTSQNPAERLIAERYLAKVANCKAIREGFRSSAVSVPGAVARRSTQPIGTGINADVELGTTYDAHGWLTELIRDGGSSRSEYALQNESGKITHHIAPAPGMNLRRYLKSRVGVIGQRGYHSQLKLDHMTAHRIVEVEKPKSTLQR